MRWFCAGNGSGDTGGVGAIALGKMGQEIAATLRGMRIMRDDAMTLQELEQQVYQLSVAERLSLLNTITRSLQQDIAQPQLSAPLDKRVLVEQLRGCLKRPGEPAPTDEEIDKMREDRLVEKYLT